ncbi:MAG: glycosyltransferase family 39 protein [Chloroflexi bacterium]|nr:glycosyltransferase family 39 protein [Chloroflexota bacterium]
MSKNFPVPEHDPTVLEALRGYFSKPAPENEPVSPAVAVSKKPRPNKLLLSALASLLVGQFLIEFVREALGGVGVLLLAVGLLLAGFAFWRERAPSLETTESSLGAETVGVVKVRLGWMLVSFVLALGASQLYQQEQVGFIAGLLWISSIATIVAAFLQPKKSSKPDFKVILQNLVANRGRTAAYLALIIVVLLFQLGRLEQVPPEMISAQVETYYTVDGILQGGSALWFPRNVVSEPLGYYWAALINQFTSSPMSFAGLKLAYGLGGLTAVLYMFKLGRRLFDEMTGYITALLLGVAFWSIIQQRAILGFGMVLPILLPAFYYLVKSLQENDLNALLIASVLTGLGLLTNKIFFVLLLANLLITIAYSVRNKRDNPGTALMLRVAISLLVGLVAMLPLVFIIASNAESWISPLVNQVANADSAASTFFRNLIAAVGMVNWNNHSSWVEGIANRPAVDWVTGAFFLFGLSVILFHDMRTKPDQSISLVLLFFVGLLPSVLSLAQPMENPSLSRAIISVVPVMLIAGRGLAFAADRLLVSENRWVKQALFIGIFAILIILRNFSLINTTYPREYQASAWNSSEMSSVIQNYDTGQGGTSQAYIVGYPHWVDARAVAITMGEPHVNFSILPQDLGSTAELQTAKIFLLHISDSESLGQLQSLYPAGVTSLYQSVHPGKDFLIFLASQ